MAFELPDHLPRGGLPHDNATQVLTKIGQATHTALNASLAASWLNELDSSIQVTKSRISQKMHDDIPAFERQLKSSMSIQTRLSELSTTVDALTDSLNNPMTGILPALLQKLTAHEILSSETNDSQVIYRASTHLLRIRRELYGLSDQVQLGHLPESAQASVRLQSLITHTPDALNRADIMTGIQKRYRTLSDRLQEQLNDAYARSVQFSRSDNTITLTILSSTSVPPTSTLISLSAIFQSLTPDSLSTHLSAFRRDLMTKIVDEVLLSLRPVTVTASESSSSLALSLSSTSSTPLQSLQTLTTFLNSHFFPHLPPAQTPFPATLHAPITCAILTHLLERSIPSSLPALPSFLDTVDEAVHFENSLLSGEARDRPIRHWVNDVAGHYEKKRRESFLRQAREVLSGPEDGSTVRIEVSIQQASESFGNSAMEETDVDAWDFDDQMTQKLPDTSTFQTIQERNGHPNDDHTSTPDVQDHESPRDEGDGSDGWGWGDEDGGEGGEVGSSQAFLPQTEVQKSDNDDPWDDDGWSTDPVPPPPQEPEPDRESSRSMRTGAPKMATRLERFSAKAKGLTAPNTPTIVSSIAPQVSSPSPPQPTVSRPPRKEPQMPPKEKETYLVSLRATKILEIAGDAMREGQELLNSNVFASRSSTKPTAPGQLLVAAAPSILDLHRALYPIAHSTSLARDGNLAILWSNDFKFLSDEVATLQRRHGPAPVERWPETVERLMSLSELSYEDAVGRQQETVRSILVGAQRFVDVSNAERFEECKSAIEQMLQEVISVANQWKQTLSRSRYVHAVGQVVDDTLFQVMDAILSLEDIPEADSERLSELCDLLTPFEELFVFVPGEESVVGSYVPLWFKFSYLSWLIKGSIADLSYLFDQGMLVDYEIGELVRLLRALFAETPLRENTIAKIAQGHPQLFSDGYQ